MCEASHCGELVAGAAAAAPAAAGPLRPDAGDGALGSCDWVKAAAELAVSVAGDGTSAGSEDLTAGAGPL